MKPFGWLLFLAVLFSTVAWAKSHPVPLVNQPLLPMTVQPGHGEFTLTVNGTGFASKAVLHWNESKLATTVVSGHQLKATIEAKDVAKAGTASITVVNPPPGGGTSNVVFFPVQVLYPSVALAPVSSSPTATASVVGDFNGDGKLDIAVGLTNTNGSGEIDIYFGKGDGTFGSPVKTPTVVGNAVMLAADFNGDGKLDLAINDGQGDTTVFLGKGKGKKGNGKMVQTQVFSSSNGWLATADFNRDGKLDLIVTGYNYNAGAYIFLGKGNGTFGSGQQILSTQAESAAVGDFNRDGILDLAIPGACGTGQGAYGLVVLLGNGDGTFQPCTVYKMSFGGYSAVAADLNGDGKLDVVTNGVAVLLGNGDGTFEDYGGIPFQNYNDTANVAVADFNGDGKLDVAAEGIYNGAAIGIFLGNGDGTIQAPALFTDGRQNSSLSIGDFNGDGKIDVYGPNLLLQTPASLIPDSIAFNEQHVGTIGNPQPVTLTNVGISKLEIKGFGIDGTDPDDFSETNNCKATLPPGHSCEIQVRFHPVATGNRSASVYVKYKGLGSPQMVALTGYAQ